jgi:hypothetical protein
MIVVLAVRRGVAVARGVGVIGHEVSDFGFWILDFGFALCPRGLSY